MSIARLLHLQKFPSQQDKAITRLKGMVPYLPESIFFTLSILVPCVMLFEIFPTVFLVGIVTADNIFRKNLFLVQAPELATENPV